MLSSRLYSYPLVTTRTKIRIKCHTNSWVIEFLRKHVKYDSSIFPIKSPLYGIPKALKIMHRPSKKILYIMTMMRN